MAKGKPFGVKKAAKPKPKMGSTMGMPMAKHEAEHKSMVKHSMKGM